MKSIEFMKNCFDGISHFVSEVVEIVEKHSELNDDQPGKHIPGGGQNGQFLTSDTAGVTGTKWKTLTIPTKHSNLENDELTIHVPSGGASGQVLGIDGTDRKWMAIEIPQAGNDGVNIETRNTGKLLSISDLRRQYINPTAAILISLPNLGNEFKEFEIKNCGDYNSTYTITVAGGVTSHTIYPGMIQRFVNYDGDWYGVKEGSDLTPLSKNLGFGANVKATDGVSLGNDSFSNDSLALGHNSVSEKNAISFQKTTTKNRGEIRKSIKQSNDVDMSSQFITGWWSVTEKRDTGEILLDGQEMAVIGKTMSIGMRVTVIARCVDNMGTAMFSFDAFVARQEHLSNYMPQDPQSPTLFDQKFANASVTLIAEASGYFLKLNSELDEPVHWAARMDSVDVMVSP